GLGSTFTVLLPLRVINEGDNRTHPTTGRMPSMRSLGIQLKNVKALVIDDEADARELLRSVLSEVGADVVTAACVDEGLAQAKAIKPDVIISDIGMPDRDGYELIREIRALPAGDGGKCPAIALTAFARSEDRTRALIAGYQVHLSKPIEPHELVVTIASLLGRMHGE
nr:response regulator [Deltaproteobacteria bacterium]